MMLGKIRVNASRTVESGIAAHPSKIGVGSKVPDHENLVKRTGIADFMAL
jgi:hypothetical protein